MFLQQRSSSSASGISASDYATAKDDLELNLIELIKAQQGGAIPSAPATEIEAEEKSIDPADNMDVGDDGDDAEAIEAARAAAQVALQEEEERKAAEEAARAANEEEIATAAAREAAEAEVAAEAQAAATAAAASSATKIEGDKDPSDFGDDW